MDEESLSCSILFCSIMNASFFCGILILWFRALYLIRKMTIQPVGVCKDGDPLCAWLSMTNGVLPACLGYRIDKVQLVSILLANFLPDWISALNRVGAVTPPAAVPIA